MRSRTTGRGVAVIENMIRPAITRRTAKRGALLFVLLVVVGALLLSISSGPAEAVTTFTVNSTGDEGEPVASQGDGTCDWDASTTGPQCTLRAAIEEANATANSGGADEIHFDIGGTGLARTISPTSELPAITEALTIDGYTQAGSSPNTLAEGNDALLNVQLDGFNAGADAHGLVIQTADSTIKGLVIRRFDGAGVRIAPGVGVSGNAVEGNFIGVNRDGITDRGNGYGLFISSESNVIGGDQPEMRNVISGNDEMGILIAGFVSGNRVEGNYIGTNADGDADLGNTEDGVTVFNASDNTIGGTAEGARNVISGNGTYGVFISGSGATGNEVLGNYIGTRASGSGALANALAGVSIQGGDFNVVGTTDRGAANRIAYNGADGVSVVNSSSTGNSIVSNSIHSNAELGIDLVGGTEDANGVTSNDATDPDTGPNGLQNFPVITSATRSNATGTTTISGRLSSDPSQEFTIQCFLTQSGTSASAYGEGLRLLDTTNVSTNANGSARFTCESAFPILGPIPTRTVSATATNEASGDSSEFSRNKTVTAGP
jgi:CSLREA domain-containing protein